jgi:tRNA(adenine34) deaminase
MREAIRLAREAAEEGEVPVGCVIVRDGQIVGRGRNRQEATHCATAHAEMEAIADASRALGGWRLADTALYVTLEPCPMCAGAIMGARIPKVFSGARDARAGACASVLNLFEERFPHKPAIVGGILEEACAQLLGEFFIDVRERP